jgi:hypothetical protein
MSKERAISLRKGGKTLNQICAELQKSKATVWGWIRSVELSPSQMENIKRFGGNQDKRAAQRAATQAMSQKYKLLKEKAFQDGFERVSGVSSVPELLLSGCMLYWAEGGKTSHLVFSNSDPRMIRLFMSFLITHLSVDRSQVRVQLNFYENSFGSDEVEGFWLGVLGLTKASLYKSQINKKPQAAAGKKVGKLPYGVCRLEVASKYKRYELQGMIEALSQRMGV